MGNAVKFTPKGGQVSHRGQTPRWHLGSFCERLRSGYPSGESESIFEKFSQGSHAGAIHRQGTGLGLAIAKNIISSHGGNIWAESQLGRAANLYLFCPADNRFGLRSVSGVESAPGVARIVDPRASIARPRRLRRFARAPFKTLSLSRKDQPPADAAIYHIGVVYAHPQNPRQGPAARRSVHSKCGDALSGEPVGRTGEGLDRRPERNRRDQSRKLSEPNSRLKSLSRKLKIPGSPPTRPSKKSKSPAWNLRDPGRKSKRSSR